MGLGDFDTKEVSAVELESQVNGLEGAGDAELADHTGRARWGRVLMMY